MKNWITTLGFALLALCVVLLIGIGCTSSTPHAQLNLIMSSVGALGFVAGGSRDFLEVMKDAEGGVTLKDASSRIANFNEKLSKFVDLVANKAGFASHKRRYLMEESATSSDFPMLMGTVLERTLLAKYQIATVDYTAYVKTGTQNDFRPTDAIGVYGLQGQLQSVVQRGEYKQDAQLGEGKMPQITLSKYGRIFGLAFENLINDDLGGFSDVAARLSDSARRTEYYQATKLFCAATGPSAGLYGAAIVHPIDTKLVNNKTNVPLTIDNLAIVLNAMRRQKDADGEPILIEGFEVVVPSSLEIQLYTILKSSAVLIAGGDSAAGSKYQLRPNVNPLDMFSITSHVNPYLEIIDQSAKAATTWYVFARLASGTAVKLNFLRGHEQPELVMKNPNKITAGGGIVNPLEGNFEEDAIWWRVRHIMGGTTCDPRMTYSSTGS